MFEEIINAYNEAIFDTDRARALRVVHDALERQGIPPEDIVFRVVLPSIERMLKEVSKGLGVTLAQHFMTSQIAAEVVEEMLPRFARAPEIIGRLVIGTSAGDFHGLGKRIVGGCLKANMVQVIDLGFNVSAERFVDEAVVRQAQIIGISSMMLHTARGDHGCRAVRRLLQEQGLEKRIKIIVGGAPYLFDDHLYRTVGADAWAENAIEAVKVVTDLIREVKS